MARFILRRLVFMVLTLFLASVVIYWATAVLPGNVATMYLGRYATTQAKTQLTDELGLNKPLAVQYTRWIGNYVKGDWGQSLSMDEAVRPVVFQRLRNSLMLAVVAFALYVPLGILLGLVAAVRRNSWVDNTISIGSLAFIGLPEFVSGVILITIFGSEAGVAAGPIGHRPHLDVRGGVSIPDPASHHGGPHKPRLRDTYDALRHH